jgi:hypothetical protein
MSVERRETEEGSKWTGEERRSGMQPKIPHHVTLEDIWILLQTHIHEENLYNKRLSKAFPVNKHGEPDFDGHGDYHTRLIDTAVRIQQRNERIFEKFLAGGIWATLVVVGSFVLNGALDWLKINLK